MKRVLIIGPGGAGKSTLARRLGELTGLEVLHLDRLYWRPGWIETPKDEWRARVEALLARDSWIMDGNYGGTLDLRLAACDTVLFLDLPRALCLLRVIRRAAKYRRDTRPDMAAGCPERLTWQFLRWVWDYPRRTRPRVLEKLAALGAGTRIVRLRSPAEVEKFLADLAAREGTTK